MIQTSSHKNGDVKQMNVKSCQNALTPFKTMRQTHGQVHCGSRHPTIMEDSTCPLDDSLQIAENESISTIYVKPKLEKKN